MTENLVLLRTTLRRTVPWGLIATVLGVAGCASVESVESAPNAHHPECAEVMLTLPESIGEFEQRPTSSQGTSVWGEPSAVVLRCGVPPIGPTDHPCVSPAGVDWVWVEQDDYVQLISYGREPSVELLVDEDQVTESAMMDLQLTLSGPVEQIEQTRECLSAEEAPAL